MGSPREERDCGFMEYAARRFVSSVFYFRLYRRTHPDHPFYVPAAIRRIEGLLRPESRVFEWGSGASTLWYAQRVAEVVSVEHDEDWYRRGTVALAEAGTAGIELAPPAPDFTDYASRVDRFPDGYFDCIAIDGRDRVNCLGHALPKLSQGGFIVLDDSHRPGYREFFDRLVDWHVERYDFGLIQTSIFLQRSVSHLRGAARADVGRTSGTEAG